jgi:hypothetical protein
MRRTTPSRWRRMGSARFSSPRIIPAPFQGTRSAGVAPPPALKETCATSATGFTDFDASPKK